MPSDDSLLDIPERYEDVTAEWLTQALRVGGALNSNLTVSTFEMNLMGANVSRNSSIARIAVQYEASSPILPDSLFIKFVSRIPGNRKMAAN